jgi:hypothetical protein
LDNTQLITPKQERIALVIILGLTAAVMLWFSSQLGFGDEQYFYNLARNPLNNTMELWNYGPISTLIMWPITQLTDNIFLLRLLPISLSIATMYLMYLTVRRKTPWALTFVFHL